MDKDLSLGKDSAEMHRNLFYVGNRSLGIILTREKRK
jgi:hypothetical protein